jgi:hypothetical protein
MQISLAASCRRLATDLRRFSRSASDLVSCSLRVLFSANDVWKEGFYPTTLIGRSSVLVVFRFAPALNLHRRFGFRRFNGSEDGCTGGHDRLQIGVGNFLKLMGNVVLIGITIEAVSVASRVYLPFLLLVLPRVRFCHLGSLLGPIGFSFGNFGPEIIFPLFLSKLVSLFLFIGFNPINKFVLVYGPSVYGRLLTLNVLKKKNGI